MTRNHIGVDLSKDRVDIHDPRTGRDSQCANSPSAIRRFLAGLARDDMIVFEGEEDRKTIQWIGFPTNAGCDRALLDALRAAGRAHVRLNPLHSWHFAQSLNLPKTDRVDARMLARLGQERQPEPALASDPAREALAELLQRRDQLRRMETQEKNRLARTADSLVARDIRASLKALGRRVAHFDAAIARQMAENDELGAQARLLASIPGIGPVVAAGLLAHLPELGRLDRRAVASLGGVAPRARDSGAFRGRRQVGPGRRHVRRLLYMAALALWRKPDAHGSFTHRLKEAGKPPKVVLMALARKLLTIANAVLRDANPYRPPTQA